MALFSEMSDEELKEFKKRKLEEIRDHHMELIQALGITRGDFNMKMPFYDKQRRYVVGIFPSEFERENGFYFEIINREYEPVDSNRTVYKIPQNDAYTEEYEMTAKGSFLVPMEELRVVNPVSVAISGPSAIVGGVPVAAYDPTKRPQFKPTGQPQKGPGTAYKAPATMEDAPYSEMTIRDHITIVTGKAVSTKPWLNDLIKSINSK